MLRYKADRRTLAVVGLYFAVAVTPWLLWPNMGTAEIVFWVALNCLLSFMCAVIIHNTIHAPMFKKRWMNKVMQVVLGFTYGHSTVAYVPGHNFSHHKYTQTDKDSIRTSKARFRINILNQLFFFFIMSGDIIKSELRFAALMRKQQPAWFRQYVVEMVLVMGVKVMLVIINWKCAVLFMLIPHQYAAWGIVGTNYFQHDGCDHDHPYNHSRTFTGGLLNFLLFNNGYHGAHHDKPNLHWSLLPAYHNEKIAPYLHPSLNRRSLVAYLIEAHIYPGKRVDYLGNPIALAPATADVDWIPGATVDKHQQDMAA